MTTTTAIDAKVLAAAEKLLAKKNKEMETRIEHIKTNYPHADVSTLHFDEAANKYSVQITCTKCGKHRTVHTSDLRVELCVDCTKEKVAAKKAVKKAELKAALELLKNR